MYAVVRELFYDPEKLARAAGQLEEFRKLHASQPGYVGSVTVDLGGGHRLAVNLWETEAQSISGRDKVGPAAGRLLEPLMAKPSNLVGAGPVVENDLTEEL